MQFKRTVVHDLVSAKRNRAQRAAQTRVTRVYYVVQLRIYIIAPLLHPVFFLFFITIQNPNKTRQGDVTYI